MIEGNDDNIEERFFKKKCLNEALKFLMNLAPDTMKHRGPGLYNYGNEPADLSDMRFLKSEPIGYEIGASYWGEQKMNLNGQREAEGRGIFIDFDGNIREGWFKDDKMIGIGRHVSITGEVYNGPYFEGLRHGEKGKLRDSEGGVYKGDFEHDRRHGCGVYTSNQGERYEGEWKDDKKHGKGYLTFANGDALTGDWIADNLQGTAICRYGNGQRSEKRIYRDGQIIQRTIL